MGSIVVQYLFQSFFALDAQVLGFVCFFFLIILLICLISEGKSLLPVSRVASDLYPLCLQNLQLRSGFMQMSGAG